MTPAVQRQSLAGQAESLCQAHLAPLREFVTTGELGGVPFHTALDEPQRAALVLRLTSYLTTFCTAHGAAP